MSNEHHSLTIGIIGASGTTGVELARLVHEHPRLTLAFATSRGAAGQSLRSVDPAAVPVTLVHPDDARIDEVDAIFACLPHGESAAVVERCVRAGTRIIDLSGDFRLADPKLHRSVYGSERTEEIASRAVYGLTECNREAIASARLVANPGCYPTCVGLALYPLARAGRLPQTVVVDAKSGISGAGRKPTPVTHYTSVVDDVRPYKLGRSHRHTPEIEQSLSGWGAGTRVVFCPHLVPLERGMLATIVVENAGADAESIRELYRAAYDDEPFVELLPPGEPARIRGVARTNLAVIGLEPIEDPSYLVITCAIDNLLKGAAGQAVQNLNRMFGIPETVGLGVSAAPIAVTA